MLHADVALFVKFNITGPMDTPSCSPSHLCQRAPTAGIVSYKAKHFIASLLSMALIKLKMVDLFHLQISLWH